MKKWMVLALSAALAVGCCACGGDSAAGGQASPQISESPSVSPTSSADLGQEYTEISFHGITMEIPSYWESEISGSGSDSMLYLRLGQTIQSFGVGLLQKVDDSYLEGVWESIYMDTYSSYCAQGIDNYTLISQESVSIPGTTAFRQEYTGDLDSDSIHAITYYLFFDHYTFLLNYCMITSDLGETFIEHSILDFDQIALSIDVSDVSPDEVSSVDLQEETQSTPTPTAAPGDSATLGEQNALQSAMGYLSISAFSYEGLIDQLEYENYTHAEATYAADHCGADWEEQALKSAQNYLKVSAFSYSGLIDQLDYAGFTSEQATYAADHCGADWKEQAAEKAKSYMDLMSFSRSDLIDQLQYEGFTYEQAVYGVTANGY